MKSNELLSFNEICDDFKKFLVIEDIAGEYSGIVDWRQRANVFYKNVNKIIYLKPKNALYLNVLRFINQKKKNSLEDVIDYTQIECV